MYSMAAFFVCRFRLETWTGVPAAGPYMYDVFIAVGACSGGCYGGHCGSLYDSLAIYLAQIIAVIVVMMILWSH